MALFQVSMNMSVHTFVQESNEVGLLGETHTVTSHHPGARAMQQRRPQRTVVADRHSLSVINCTSGVLPCVANFCHQVLHILSHRERQDHMLKLIMDMK
jgi:hypothetical protein